jgi:hypothetical protein
MLSQSKGYDISVGNGENHMVTVRAWGVWKTEDQILARNFTRELQTQVEHVSKDGEEWCLCEDFVRFCPQSREVCQILGDGLLFAIQHGMKKAIHCKNTCNKCRRLDIFPN